LVGPTFGTVVSRPSNIAPSATMSVWFIVTRIVLLEFVCQLEKKAGVVKKPMRGRLSTSELAWRRAGRL
jgi:hypothetical protein